MYRWTYRTSGPAPPRGHGLSGTHFATQQAEPQDAVLERERRAHAAHVLLPEEHQASVERLGVRPAQPPELAIGVPAEVHPGDSLLPGIAALGVGHAADLVVAHFLGQGPGVDLDTVRDLRAKKEAH